jgi:alkylation response protein AidB-like acyl-CoA dehydrogenase
MTWPKEYGGSEGEGVYEYILNEELAGRGGPQIGKGVGIIGKTLIAHGSDFLKDKFLPMILENDVEFAVGYSEPNAGSDAASMRLKGVKHTTEDGREGWLSTARRRGPPPPTSPSGTGAGCAPTPTTSTWASR